MKYNSTPLNNNLSMQDKYNYRSIINRMHNGFSYQKIILDEQNNPIDYIILDVNEAYEKLIGFKKEEVIGKRIKEIFPDIDNFSQNWIKIYARVALEGVELEYAEYFSKRMNRWYSMSAFSPEKYHFVTIFEDITELKNRISYEKLINEISSRFINLNIEDIDDEITKSLKLIGEFTDVDRCFIYSLSDDFNSAYLKYEWNVNKINLYHEKNYKIDISYYSYFKNIIKNNKNFYFADIDELPEEEVGLKKSLNKMNIKSLLLVGMHYNKQIYGVLGFDSITKRKLWKNSDIMLVETLANTFMNAIENKHLQELNKKYYLKLVILNDIISLSNKTNDLNELLNNSLISTLELLYFESGIIYLFDYENNIANIKCSHNLDAEIYNEMHTLPIDKYPFNIIINEGKPIVKERNQDIQFEVVKKLGYISIIATPLISNENIIGCLIVGNKSQHYFSKEEKIIFRSIGQELGIAIDKISAENNIRENQKNLHNLFNSLEDLLFVIDFNYKIIEVNTTVSNKLGYQREELIGKDIFELHDKKSHDKVKNILNSMLSNDIDISKFILKCKNGELIEVDSKITKGLWSNKNVIFEISRDISKQKIDEEKLKRLNMALEQSSDGIIILDLKGIVQFVNNGFLNLYNYEDENELIGNQIENSFTNNQYINIINILNDNDHNNSKASYQTEITHIKNDGQKITTWINSSLIKDENGKAIGIVIISRDLTELNRLKNTIKESKSKIETLENTIKTITKDNIEFGTMVGKSQKMREVYDLIRNTADTDVNIFVYGESGTGKELVAHAIHKTSKRKNNKFLPLNCSALPEHLFESELFGYEKGAFTNAYKSKEGKFEYADGGTLFLDEIADLSAHMQAKLLRVLEDKVISRLGSNKLIHVDVRIITATNKDLENLVKIGKFREDLFYRLNVITINLPPLRERKEDIIILTKYFIDKFNIEHNKNIKSISDSFYQFINNNNWKGNVRELENTIEKCVILSETDILDSPIDILVDTKSHDDIKNIMEQASLKFNLELYEKELISKVLEKNNLDLDETAITLNIDKRTLYRKIKKYSINI